MTRHQPPPQQSAVRAACQAHLCRITGHLDPFDAADALHEDIARLLDLFTTERPEQHGAGFADYMASPRALAAYNLFFLPRSQARAAWCLDQLQRLHGWTLASHGSHPIRIADLGCGPGPCALAALACCPGPVELFLADHAQPALNLAAELCSAAHRHVSIQSRCTNLAASDPHAAAQAALPAGNFELITIGFACNELAASRGEDWLRAWLTALGQRLHPRGLMLILDPAARHAAQRLVNLQVDPPSGLHPWGPALAPDALATQASTPQHPPPAQSMDQLPWEHEVRQWQVPELLKHANRRLHVDLTHLSFSWLALGRHAPAPCPPSRCRLTAPLALGKGRFLTALERADGSRHSLQIPFGGRAKHICKAWAEAFERGDLVIPVALTPTGDPSLWRAADLQAAPSS